LAVPRNSTKNIRIAGLWVDNATRGVPSMKSEDQLTSTSRVNIYWLTGGWSKRISRYICVASLNIYFMSTTRFLRL